MRNSDEPKINDIICDIRFLMLRFFISERVAHEGLEIEKNDYC